MKFSLSLMETANPPEIFIIAACADSEHGHLLPGSGAATNIDGVEAFSKPKKMIHGNKVESAQSF